MRALAARAALCVLGLALGLVLFAPWQRLWREGMESLTADNEALAIDYAAMPRASFTGFMMENVRLAVSGRSFFAHRLEVELGLFTPVTLTVESGGERLVLAAGWGKTLDVDGTASLGHLAPGEGSEGVVSLRGEALFRSFGGQPRKGALTVDAPELRLQGAPALGGLKADLQLGGSRVHVARLTIDAPVDMEISGDVDLNWNNILLSPSEFQGAVSMGGSRNEFSKRGPLKLFLGLSSGGFSQLF